MSAYMASQLYGVATPVHSGVGVAAPTQRSATDDLAQGWRALVDPANPLLWLGIVLAVTLGLGGVAGSVRLGRARASVDVGDA